MAEEKKYFASVEMIDAVKYTEEVVIKLDDDFSTLNTDKYGKVGEAVVKHLPLLDSLCKSGIKLQNEYFAEMLGEKMTAGRVRLTVTGDSLRVSSFTLLNGNKVSVSLHYTLKDNKLQGLGCDDIDDSKKLLEIYLDIVNTLVVLQVREVVAIYNLMVINDILAGLAREYKVQLVDKEKAEKHVIANIGLDFVDLIVDKEALLELQGSEIEKLYVKDPFLVAQDVYNEWSVLEFLVHIKNTVLVDYVKAVKKLGLRKRVKLLSLIRKDFKLIDLEERHHYVYGYYKIEDDILRLYTLSEENIYVNNVSFEMSTNDFVKCTGEMYQFDTGKLIQLR